MEIQTPLKLSNRSLFKSSVIATILAVFALVFIILPAEYQIDPTGLGKKIGLLKLSANQPIAEVTSNQVNENIPQQENAVVIEVPARSGLEYKFFLQQYDKLEYHWTTDGETLYFDFHGEPEGDTSGFFESYTIATANQMQGMLTTPFAGSHGWYWRNDNDKPITIRLTTKGMYQIIGLKL